MNDSVQENIWMTPGLEMFFNRLKHFKKRLHHYAFTQNDKTCALLYCNLDDFFKDGARVFPNPVVLTEEGKIKKQFINSCNTVLDDKLGEAEEEFHSALIRAGVYYLDSKREDKRNPEG